MVATSNVHATQAEESWLTITGDMADAGADTVQALPNSLVVFSELRTMKIRVNRALPRRAYDGQMYRSYRAQAHFNCQTKDARYSRLDYFAGPHWSGETWSLVYAEDKMPPMAFADTTPNPRARLIQAACTLNGVKTS